MVQTIFFWKNITVKYDFIFYKTMSFFFLKIAGYSEFRTG